MPVIPNAELPNKGPNQILPADELWAVAADGCVKFRDSHGVDYTPISVPGAFMEMAKKYPEHESFAYKEAPTDKGFKIITYKEYLDKVQTVAKAFIELGLERNRGVIILGRNSPQWAISFFGAIFAGGYAGGLYQTNSSEVCLLSLKKVEAQIVVVEDDQQLQKILKIKEDLPNLKAIVQFDGEPNTPDVLSWSKLLTIGSALNEDKLNDRLSRIAINQVATIVFTSGTTGQPKVAMLSHDCIIYEVIQVLEGLGVKEGNSIVSFLPLSHIAAQVIDLFASVLMPVSVYFANKDALRGSLLFTLKEVRPTLLVTVPRVLEKLVDLIKAYYAKDDKLLEAALKLAEDQLKGKKDESVAEMKGVISAQSELKQMLGFDRIQILVSGAAPVSAESKKWLLAAGVVVLEVFGLSEISGILTINTPFELNILSCGKALRGSKLKLHKPDGDGEGEVCIYTRAVMMGYMNDEEQTKAVIDDEGYFHTGDLGKLDENGFLFVTGRIKDLIVTSGGENISPTYYENNIKGELPFLSQAVMIGDRRKYLTILLTIGSNVDPATGMPTDVLNHTALKWISELGLPFKTVSEIIKSGPHPKILESIQKGIDACNAKAISNAQKAQKFTILPADFSIPTGEFGPTFKLKRSYITEKYKDTINKLYE